jgi:hypothetical protein
MTAMKAQQTPAQTLADRITARLQKESLLAEDRAPRFSTALALGKLKAGDWRLAIEVVKQPKPTSSTE